MHVPTNALLTTDSIADAFIARHDEDMAVHGLLASFLTNGSSSSKELGRWRPWQATWPSYEDFAQSIPMLWPAELHKSWLDPATNTVFWPLPGIISGQQSHWDYTKKPARKAQAESLVHAQQRKFERDWEKTVAVYPNTPKREYMRSWLIVNTRSFFYDQPLSRKPRTHADKMILCPLIDYFNHADAGCRVQYDDTGYSVTADRDYKAGEQLFVSYGAHSNDFLWAEYGFVPTVNCHDTLCLDPWMLAPSTGIEKSQAHRLRKAGYLDNYHIVAVEGAGEVCHRTQVAVRAAVMRPARWQQYVRGKDLAADGDAEANEFIREQLLVPFRDIATQSLRGLDNTEESTWETVRRQLHGSQDQQCLDQIKSTLVLRWKQILRLLDQAIEKSNE